MSSANSASSPLTIGELAQVTGTSRRALRHYEAEGLLPARRLANGYRSFDRDAIARVRAIRSLLRLGLPLRLIQQVLPCVETESPPGVCADAIALLEEHGARLSATAQEAVRRRDATAQLARTLATGRLEPRPLAVAGRERVDGAGPREPAAGSRSRPADQISLVARG